MAAILLIGADGALLEGIAQALSVSGHHVLTATTLAEASFVAAAAPPLVTAVDRALLTSLTDVRSFGIAPGGVLVAYGDPALPLPAAVRRLLLAELRLPLERSRLIALAAHVEERARSTGRDSASPTPPESHPGV